MPFLLIAKCKKLTDEALIAETGIQQDPRLNSRNTLYPVLTKTKDNETLN